MKKVTWPDEREREKLNRKIFGSDANPFFLDQYTNVKDLDDFVNREEQIDFFKEKIRLLFQNNVSRAVRLEGPYGVGKSTLFNFLKQRIDEERNPKTNDPKTDFILTNYDIYSTYFDLPEEVSQFSQIWKPIIKGLSTSIEIETGHIISFVVYVVLKIVYRLFELDRKTLADIIWEDNERPRNLNTIQFNEIILPIKKKGSEAVGKLQEYYSNHIFPIRDNLKCTIGDITYSLNRDDNKQLKGLFRVIDENDEYHDQIQQGSIFSTNQDQIQFFNDVSRYLTCATGKQPIFLIGIEEVAQAKTQRNKEDYYETLGTFFVSLRNNLQNILFVFISTTGAWKEFDKSLYTKTDLRGQLDAFIKPCVLPQLEVKELIKVFRKRMLRYWNKLAPTESFSAPYYPFSDNMFEYVYEFFMHDLRKAIQFLGKMWTNLKHTKNVPKLETMFECMQEVRKRSKKPIELLNLEAFEYEIINDYFETLTGEMNNAERSSLVEQGLTDAWKCLILDTPPIVTSAEKGPGILVNRNYRYPDVYVKIHENLGAEFRRTFEFQVKMYRDDTYVPFSRIDSSLELFEKDYTDYLYFIITGKGLDPKGEAEVTKLESVYFNRIFRNPVNPTQKKYLNLLSIFDQIMGRKLGEEIPEDIETAKDILSIIIGYRVEEFLGKIRDSSFKEVHKDMKPIIGLAPTSKPIEEPLPIKKPIQEPQPSFESNILWLNEYPDLEPYKYELSALCIFMQKREPGMVYEWLFRPPTVNKMIEKDASLDNKIFLQLVEYMKNHNYIFEKSKDSYLFTESGQELYWKIKKEKYKCV